MMRKKVTTHGQVHNALPLTDCLIEGSIDCRVPEPGRLGCNRLEPDRVVLAASDRPIRLFSMYHIMTGGFVL